MEFRERLRGLGLSQVGFAREVAELAGETFSHRTVQNWAMGVHAIPPPVAALLTLLEERTREVA